MTEIPSESDIRDALRQVLDPEIGVNIVDLGLIYRIEIEETRARIAMTLTSPACQLVGELGRLRSWRGLVNALALLLFMINTGRPMALWRNSWRVHLKCRVRPRLRR